MASASPNTRVSAFTRLTKAFWFAVVCALGACGYYAFFVTSMGAKVALILVTVAVIFFAAAVMLKVPAGVSRRDLSEEVRREIDLVRADIRSARQSLDVVLRNEIDTLRVELEANRTELIHRVETVSFHSSVSSASAQNPAPANPQPVQKFVIPTQATPSEQMQTAEWTPPPTWDNVPANNQAPLPYNQSMAPIAYTQPAPAVVNQPTAIEQKYQLPNLDHLPPVYDFSSPGFQPLYMQGRHAIPEDEDRW